ncbi:hypothetical protein D918_07876 [Trichuris suis]|nr:hypothetical protein D918_07876 [Trichuris suis]
MAANVSVEEFSRLQQQFLDVRKEYYELLEAASRKDSGLVSCRLFSGKVSLYSTTCLGACLGSLEIELA